MTVYALPYPPSVNNLWRNIVIKGRPRTVLTVEGRQYREKVRAGLATIGAAPLEGPVCVELRVYRPRRIGDLDNTAKAVLDAVKGLLFGDDSQVVELHMYRGDDKANPRVEVFVLPMVVGPVARAEAASDVEVDPSDYERPARLKPNVRGAR